MKRLKLLSAVVQMLALAAGCVHAETYQLSRSVTMSATGYADGMPVRIRSDAITVLGADDEGRAVAYASRQLFCVPFEVLGGISEVFASAELTPLSEIPTLKKGDKSDDVAEVQRGLITLGYLEDDADGAYGNVTKKAVNAFQKDYGLTQTGDVDAITRQLLLSFTAEAIPVELPPVEGGEGSGEDVIVLADEKWLEDLDERTEADLSPMSQKGLSFEYDDIGGTGFVGNGSEVSWQNGEGYTDLDSYGFTFVFGFNVTVDAKGAATVRPAANIENESVRRPLMQTVILKSGDLRSTLKVTGAAASLAGSHSREKGTLNLNADACALLAQCAEAGELKLRVQGKYESFDFEVPNEKLGDIAAIGEIGRALLAG